MDILPLQIGVTPQPRSYDALNTIDGPCEPVGAAIRHTVHARDAHTCRFCGFASLKYQQAVVVDGSPRDVDAVATACIFCQQALRLDTVSSMRSGVLLWLPEVGQAELHHMARDIYHWRVSRGQKDTRARHLLDVLMQRRVAIRERIDTDDPYWLAKRLRRHLYEEHCPVLAEARPGIRLFPLDRRIIKTADLEFNQFPQILAYWRSRSGPLMTTNRYPGIAELETRLPT